MTIETIPYRFLVRGGTTANLATVNEVPLARELVYATDTGLAKLGNGLDAYNDLPYIEGPPPDAADIDYDNSASGLAATDVQAAIDELAAVSGTRGITVTGGAIGGAVIPAASVVGGLAASDYTLTGNWYLWCSPSGSIELDVRASAFGALPPNSGDSICVGNEPAVVGAVSASGDFTGWSPAIARGDALSVVVNSVTDVTWFVLLLEAV